MTSTDLFWAVLAGVLGANLLTAMFVWAAIQVGRRERATESPGVYMIGFLLPIAVCGMAFYVSVY